MTNYLTMLANQFKTTDITTKPKVDKTKKSNGQLFKEKYGFSKSMKRNMQKRKLLLNFIPIQDLRGYEIDDILTTYRKIRNKNN